MNLKDRVGILGGTFNPVHDAHLTIARTALGQCGLSRILFVPNGTPPGKRTQKDPGREHRFRMVAEAIRGEERYSVSRIEVDRDGPSYTIDTIRALKDDYSEGICLIVGADCLMEIDTWREPDAILASLPIVVAPRVGVRLDALEPERFRDASIYVLDMPEVEVSSTALRERVRRGASIDDSVPSAVARYIEENGLYRGAEQA